MKHIRLAFALFVLFFAIAAHANEVRFRVAIPETVIADQQNAIQGFDPAWGTLTGVQVIFRQKTQATLGLENMGSASSCTVTWGIPSLRGIVDFTAPPLPGQSTGIPIAHVEHELGQHVQTVGGPFDGIIDFLGASGGTDIFAAGKNQGVIYQTQDPAELPAWINAGTVQLQTSHTFGSGSVGGCGSTAIWGYLTSSGTVTVVYTYL